MKKVLFATTALVATAGIASAEVTVSGIAEMGIASTETLTATGGTRATDTEDGTPGTSSTSTTDGFFTSVDVRFTLSGEADNGLTFGAVIDLEDAAESGDNVDVLNGGADYSVFISGDFGTLTMGDTDGALDWAMTEAGNVGNPGTIADNETSHAGYLGSYGDDINSGQILRYDYTIGDFGIALSVEGPDDDDTGYAIGFRYGVDFAGGRVNFGAGYQTAQTQNGRYAPNGLVGTALDIANGGDGINVANDFCQTGTDEDGCAATAGDGYRNIGFGAGDDVDIAGLSVTVVLDNGFSAGLQYSDWDIGAGEDGAEITHTAVGLGYTFDAISLHMNYGQFDIDDGPTISGYGLAAAYDFGGGLSAHVGYGASDFDTPGVPDVSNWSLGLAMSF